MEWIETSGKTIEEATQKALKALAVAPSDLEVQVINEAKSGLFGRIKIEARIRARVLPRDERPKQRSRDRRDRQDRSSGSDRRPSRTNKEVSQVGNGEKLTKPNRQNIPKAKPANKKMNLEKKATKTLLTENVQTNQVSSDKLENADDLAKEKQSTGKKRASREPITIEERTMGELMEESLMVKEFLYGLAKAMDLEVNVSIDQDNQYLNANIEGEGLGFLVGKKGMTLAAIQDLSRLAARNKAGDGSPNRVNVDIAGYKKKRAEALVTFAQNLANQVIETGVSKALEPMSPADRKTVHDALTEFGGVQTSSMGREPTRYVVIQPSNPEE